MRTRLVFSRSLKSIAAPLTAGVMALINFTPSVAQDRVNFVHGLATTGSIWANLSNYVNANFNVVTLAPTLPWNATYETQSSNLQAALAAAGFTNAVAVSNSNGSVVTRRYLVDNGQLGSRINRHLAIGGLHQGALLANSMRSGATGWWLGGLVQAIREPFQVYVFDPLFASSQELAAWENALYDFVNGFLEPSYPNAPTLYRKIVELGFDVALPVVAQMEPGSATFIDINSFPSRQAEAAATTAQGRVSIATRTNPDLLPWSNFVSRGAASEIRIFTRVAAWLGAFLYGYYAQHPDPYLQGNAWMWLRMYWWLELIPVSWADQTGALLGFAWSPLAPGYYLALYEPSDGLLPMYSTQRYVGGTSFSELTVDDILHTKDQRSHPQIRLEVNRVLRFDFNVPPVGPPPPGSAVSAEISGPLQVTSGELRTWTASATGGGGGYTYAWYLAEGGGPLTFVGAGSSQSATFYQCTGGATVRVEVWAADSSAAADEIQVSVTCPALTASISGQAEISPTAICTWVASANGGVTPYSYEWRRNGVFVGTTSEYTGGMDGASSFTLDLKVTDNAGAIVNDQMTVTNTGFGECLN